MGLLSRGSDDEEKEKQQQQAERESLSSMLNSPFTVDVLDTARENEIIPLDQPDRELEELVEEVQAFVESYDYNEKDNRDQQFDDIQLDELPGPVPSVGSGRSGNLYIDWLDFQFRQNNLIEPRKVTADTLFAVVTEGVWAHIGEARGFNNNEIVAVRNVHNIYSAQRGLADSMGYSTLVIRAEHDQLREFTQYPDVDDDEFHASQYEAERRSG